jgi:hypothetical protein
LSAWSSNDPAADRKALVVPCAAAMKTLM